MLGMRYNYVRICERFGRAWKRLSEVTAELQLRGVAVPAGVNTFVEPNLTTCPALLKMQVRDIRIHRACIG